jgi:ABC-type uncharacterized transport system permease subunit
MDIGILVLTTILTAATPLLLAALGEYVVERAGILNLGVEGMMVVGASAAFGAATYFDSGLLGILAGMLAGMLLSALFAFFVLGLATNQVATGLALTIFGGGVANLAGAPFVGAQRDALKGLALPDLAPTSLFRLILGQDPFVYVSILMAIAIALFLKRSRTGLVLRGIGEAHGSAHALGLPVRKVRFVAILFGGALAGLAGAYLSLVYTPFWSPGMTAGRGWIALAIVVFSGGHVSRLVLGAYIFGAMTVAQLHAQAGSIAVPAQLLSALPYIATLLSLILLSLRRGGGGSAAASLGQPFVPDR